MDSGTTIILTLHRIGAKKPHRLRENEDMKVSTTGLRRFIESARRHGWTFVSMDEIGSQLESPARRGAVKQLALTFDDGYKDNLSEGYPLLRELAVPFCVYVTTGFVSNQVKPWWYVLEAVLSSGSTLKAPDGTDLDFGTGKEVSQVFMRIRKDLLQGPAQQRDAWRSWLKAESENLQNFSDEPMMTWEDVRTLALDPLVTIGAHTVSHPSLAVLSREDALDEIRESRSIIESHIGKAVRNFAYPYGGRAEAGPREIDLVRSCGFLTATTTRYGSISSRSKPDAHALPRIMYTDGFTLRRTAAMLYCQRFVHAVRKLGNPLRSARVGRIAA
jgi:peptidoglycan/xylan/chitin deacetylase (PgdA/CDA1 family)